MFPNTAYIGGSFILNQTLHPKIEYSDIDIFIYQPRPMESWALEQLIEQNFYFISRGYNYTGKYRIDGQYKHYKVRPYVCGAPNMDLIFIDPRKVTNWKKTVGSSLAAKQLKIDYSARLYTVEYPSIHLRDLFDTVLETTTIRIFRGGNTASQIDKVKARAKVLGMNYRIENP